MWILVKGKDNSSLKLCSVKNRETIVLSVEKDPSGKPCGLRFHFGDKYNGLCPVVGNYFTQTGRIDRSAYIREYVESKGLVYDEQSDESYQHIIDNKYDFLVNFDDGSNDVANNFKTAIIDILKIINNYAKIELRNTADICHLVSQHFDIGEGEFVFTNRANVELCAGKLELTNGLYVAACYALREPAEAIRSYLVSGYDAILGQSRTNNDSIRQIKAPNRIPDGVLGGIECKLISDENYDRYEISVPEVLESAELAEELIHHNGVDFFSRDSKFGVEIQFPIFDIDSAEVSSEENEKQKAPSSSTASKLSEFFGEMSSDSDEITSIIGTLQRYRREEQSKEHEEQAKAAKAKYHRECRTVEAKLVNVLKVINAYYPFSEEKLVEVLTKLADSFSWREEGADEFVALALTEICASHPLLGEASTAGVVAPVWVSEVGSEDSLDINSLGGTEKTNASFHVNCSCCEADSSLFTITGQPSLLNEIREIYGLPVDLDPETDESTEEHEQFGIFIPPSYDEIIQLGLGREAQKNQIASCKEDRKGSEENFIQMLKVMHKRIPFHQETLDSIVNHVTDGFYWIRDKQAFCDRVTSELQPVAALQVGRKKQTSLLQQISEGVCDHLYAVSG